LYLSGCICIYFWACDMHSHLLIFNLFSLPPPLLSLSLTHTHTHSLSLSLMLSHSLTLYVSCTRALSICCVLCLPVSLSLARALSLSSLSLSLSVKSTIKRERLGAREPQNEILDGQRSGLFSNEPSNEPFKKKPVMTGSQSLSLARALQYTATHCNTLSNEPFEKKPVMTGSQSLSLAGALSLSSLS